MYQSHWAPQFERTRTTPLEQMMFDLSRPDEPVLIRRGPVAFSTGQALQRSPVVCWDVNRYYRDLGIGWPYLDASRGALRRAYLLLDGASDSRLTFCLKALLDRENKEKYDRALLGQTFFDPYVIAEIKRRAMAELRDRGFGQEDINAVKEAFDQYGMDLGDDTPEDGIDSSNEEGHDDNAPAREIAPFPYSFYLWRSTCQDIARLDQWQWLLITAFAEIGLSRSISLGYVGHHPHDWMLGKVGSQDVVFLNERLTPSPEHAAAVARRLHEHDHLLTQQSLTLI